MPEPPNPYQSPQSVSQPAGTMPWSPKYKTAVRGFPIVVASMGLLLVVVARLLPDGDLGFPSPLSRQLDTTGTVCFGAAVVLTVVVIFWHWVSHLINVFRRTPGQ